MGQWLIRFALILLVLGALAVPWLQQWGVEPVDVGKTPTEVTPALALPPIFESPRTRTYEVPEFSSIHDITERKVEFFGYLMPAIRFENDRILAQRDTLLTLHEKWASQESLLPEENVWLEDLASYYRVDSDDFARRFATLIRRVDVIPETLVLIQAANESGWGTSRFAQDARNFFGQWCWSAGCGIVPAARPEGERYEVRKFETMEASVRSYIRNLNTHFAYEDLRTIRYQLRLNEEPVTSVPLTAGLMSYSERGEDYIDELNQMIRVNRPIIIEVGEELAVNDDCEFEEACA